MIYGSVPMMIFILASGYLFTVYLLLALAKRTGTKTAPRSFASSVEVKHEQEISVRTNVTEAVNSQ
ncbi:MULTISPECIES: hypothetical protein [Nostoc]|uniref:Uncharacterized protein n=1 Tax=Nostoc paludosum FACHB-159 TaxID=2692908 RepID=A0ABR8K851_9NOSO|nr:MULTISPECIES: hypothetical protein [Nostoc]MBD2679268.1 hypothetical protein [Nostoc sp. FACHB-857]MBD2735650.1 hypothetical protein [Nostoc paludosum FACHB-159]MDZ8104198.1 hypothetical protein [Nostoc sp. DedQUE12a]